MPIEAVLFDLGNTPVAYSGSARFPTILREGLRNAAESPGYSPNRGDEEQIYERDLAINREPGDYAVRPLAVRLRELFRDRVDVDPSGLSAA